MMGMTDEPSVLHSASSAELSDIEHTELISQYASDQYLRKWSLEDQENDASNFSDYKDKTKHEKVFVPHLAGSRLLVPGQTVPGGDCDGVSLLSFNSVQDCAPSLCSATVNTVTPHPAYQLQDSLDFKIWQGYGGNVYFEPMRCNTMTIYSARPPKMELRPELRHWKSKSHRLEKKLQRSNMERRPRDTAVVSVGSLGSLRIKTREEQVQSCRKTGCSVKTSGKIYKGFSKNLIAESHSSSHRHLRCESAPEPMQVTGGHVMCDSASDLIHKVQLYNSDLHWPRASRDELTSSSFPTLSANILSPSHANGSQQNIVTGPFVKLPQLDSKGKVKKASKKRTQCVDEARDDSQVLIIPFGAFDDPVEVESTNDQLRRKCVEDNARADTKCKEGMTSGTSQALAMSEKHTHNRDSVSCEMMPREITHQISHGNEAITCRSMEAAQQCAITDTSKADGKIKGKSIGQERNNSSPDRCIYQNPQSANLCLRREISNVSLSNYLKAVPTQLPTTSDKQLLHGMSANNMPRLSYTQRTKARPSLYISNSHHMTHPFGTKANGYVPCKGKQPARSDTNTEKERSRKYLYIQEVRGQDKPSKSRPQERNPRSRDQSLVCTKPGKSKRLMISEALLGHQLVKSSH